ncbi:CCA tRNA nucleotidyltransferase [Azorhizobium doebereinerae]|uniref:CCA tRNA nucleotidyltransferase n=1 Tax=Azorhizobium doebereinerae TaxID=281091 RepID=UPI00055939E5|nr:CCA tRNA nucleotidyltransferase [Azorhizobium doebereinerae]
MSAVAGRDIADAPWLKAPALRAVLAALNGAGEETRIVGGAVRNALLGVPVSEVDLAGTCRPEEVVRRAEAAGLKTVPTGLAHGTVTVISQGVPFEVTSLREDVETDGRHAVVRFGRDWAHDAARRDFTLNALYADAQGCLYDPLDGLPDLLARRVRFIGDPEARIREDHLRILRLFRFHAAYGVGPVDPPALGACVRLRAGFDRLSRERVRAEVMKLLVAAGAAATLVEMSDAGLLGRILGGVADLPGFARLAALEAGLGLKPAPIRRLGVLAVRISEDAERLRVRLRLANAEYARLAALAPPSAIAPGLPPAEARRAMYALGREAFLDQLLIAAARRGGDPAPLADLCAAWVPPDFPLTAADLMARGLKPGPALGAALARAKAAWIAADFPADAEVIDALARAAIDAGPDDRARRA